MKKICPICNTEFIAGKGNVKYCSPECRRKAEYARHNEWATRTNYAEKKRVEMRQRRLKEAEAHREHLRQMHDERIRQIQEDNERADQELHERAEAGDNEALMKLAEKAGDRAGYYKYFALYEIEREEKDFGRRSTRTVNGISVYDPDFAELVMKSIEETGQCISKINGQGIKIDAMQI
ncbi:MAG: DUF2256 domain-containing protein [Lachnospiraceae bacterium]|nr:DUF2256 domain-containing protein [Lachnospiraceae bacterium]